MISSELFKDMEVYVV